MESNPWADQWDHKNNSPDQTTETKKSQGGAKATNLTKIQDGMKKLLTKETTDACIRWIKDKYHKATKKPKKESHESGNRCLCATRIKDFSLSQHI